MSKSRPDRVEALEKAIKKVIQDHDTYTDQWTLGWDERHNSSVKVDPPATDVRPRRKGPDEVPSVAAAS